jgi:hypothetical protein
MDINTDEASELVHQDNVIRVNKANAKQTHMDLLADSIFLSIGTVAITASENESKKHEIISLMFVIHDFMFVSPSFRAVVHASYICLNKLSIIILVPECKILDIVSDCIILVPTDAAAPDP